MLKPETGYFPFDNCNVLNALCFIFGCFGITNAVCFKSERSLHKADINGKSKSLLRSRNTFISIGVDGGTVFVDVCEFVTGLIGDVIFCDAFVRGKVVVTGCTAGLNFWMIAIISIEKKTDD